ncbi:MAG: lactate utilization protein C, partial [Halobacteriales archaeon]
MAPDLLETFESALDGLGVTHERTTTGGLPETVTGAVSEPAVGAELPWDGLTLDDTPVDQSPTPAAL